MRKILLAMAIVMLVSPAFTEPVLQQDIDRIIYKKLSFRGWGVASDIILAKNNRYKLMIYCLGYGPSVHSEGQYELNGGKVILHQESCKDEDTGMALNHAENYDLLILTIEKSDADLYYSQYLVLELTVMKADVCNLPRLQFGIPDTKVPVGSLRSFDGIEVATMDMQKGVTIVNAKIRLKPSIKSKSVQYMETPYGPGLPKESVPAGTTLVIKARTLEKEQVNQWNNYWYLVDVGVHENVWIFGELIRPGK